MIVKSYFAQVRCQPPGDSKKRPLHYRRIEACRKVRQSLIRLLRTEIRNQPTPDQEREENRFKTRDNLLEMIVLESADICLVQLVSKTEDDQTDKDQIAR